MVTQDATRDSTCQACPTGRFQAAIGYAGVSCPSVKTQSCAAGTYLDKKGDATQNDVCVGCASGTFKVGTNAVQACDSKTAVCPEAQQLVRHDATKDDICVDCSPSTFKSVADASACTPKKITCPAGQHLLLTSAAEDDACVDCEAGRYSPAIDNSIFCLPKGDVVTATSAVAVTSTETYAHMGSSNCGNPSLLPCTCAVRHAHACRGPALFSSRTCPHVRHQDTVMPRCPCALMPALVGAALGQRQHTRSQGRL